MEYCGQCKSVIRIESLERCVCCGASLRAPGAVLNVSEIARQNRAQNKRISYWSFVGGSVGLALLPLLFVLLLGIIASPMLWLLVSVSALVSAVIIHAWCAGRFRACLVFCVPQLLLIGLNPFLMVMYVCIGMAIGIWRESMLGMA